MPHITEWDKIRKKVQFKKMHSLPQIARLKLIISKSIKRGPPIKRPAEEGRNNFKNHCANIIVKPPVIYCTIFPFLALHCVLCIY